MALFDAFLKLEGIPGESGDARHKGEIEVLSFSWGGSQAGTMAFGGGGGAGKVQMQDLHFTMNVNKASPKLFLACANGEHLKSAVFTARKAGRDQQDYLQVKLGDVLVSSFQTGGSEAGAAPIDQVSFNFAKIEVEYKPQKPDGSLGAAVQFRYDLKANKTF